MNLKNVASVNDCKSDLYDAAVNIISEAFLEEPWFEYVLSAVDDLYDDDAETARWRKRCLIRSMIEDDIRHHGRNGLYLLDDGTAALGALQHSEKDEEDQQQRRKSALLETATPEELKAIDDRKHDIDRITMNDWGSEYERHHGRADADCIHVYAVAVSKQARGSGALRRMFESLFEYADASALNVYLECYKQRLRDIYQHFGFEVVDELACDNGCDMRCWMMRRKWQHPTIR